MNRSVAREVAVDKNFQVTVAAPSFFHGDLRPLELEPEPANSAIRVVPIRTHLTQFIHLFSYDQSSLTRLIRNGGFDVVHAWEEPYIYAGYQIAKALAPHKVRFCFRTAQSYVKRYPPPFGFFERTVLDRCQGWIAGASLVQRAMLQRGYPEKLGRVLNLAVDLNAFRVLAADERAAVIQELGLKPPIVGFMGRLTAAKGINIILEAMDCLLNREWSLLFLGSGECKREIVAWAVKRGVSDRVRILLARHDEVPRYLAAMDLLLAPSQTTKSWCEQFGRMIIEAFACGVPVIGSDSGEIPHVISNAGRVVQETDVSAWAKSISELLEDQAAREHLTALGLQRVEQFSVSANATKYRDYYQWLADQPLA